MIWILVFILLITALIFYHQNIKQFVYNKLRIEQIQHFHISFKNYRLFIHIKGIQLNLKPSKATIKPNSTKTPWIESIVSLRLIYLFISCITKCITIDIQQFALCKESFVFKVDYILIENDKKIFIKLGLLQLDHNESIVFKITTPCLMMIDLLKQSKLDLEFQLGKIFVYFDKCMKLVSSSSSNSNTTTTTTKKFNFINSVRVNINSFHLISTKLQCNIYDINLIGSRHQTPLIQLNTKLFEILILNISIVIIPSMDITISRSQHDTIITPFNQFISVTWIFNSPNINIPLNKPELFNQLISQNNNNPTERVEKIFKDLPLCTFAIVFNSPKLKVTPTTIQEEGFIIMESFIIRFSGEYVKKGRYDIPSSSSGSSSQLDALFVQEEYQWIRKNNTHQHLTTKWLQLMDKLSPHYKQENQQWSFRISCKVMIHKLKSGHIDENTIEKEFLRIKHTTLVFKLRLNVNLNQLVYETLFSLNSGIQSEISIDKPVISLWNDKDIICSSLFWLKVIPNSIHKSNRQKTTTKKPLPIWIQNINFSLEVSEGSIHVSSLDKALEKITPNGYIDNTPKETISSCFVLQTQRFNFVCEGPSKNTENEWKSRCQIETFFIQHGQEQKIVWISQFNIASTLSTQHQLKLSCKLKKYGIFYSVQHHYICLLLVKSLLNMKQALKSEQKKKEEKPKSAMIMDIDFHIARGDIKITLPNKTQLYHRIDDFSLEYKQHVLIKFRNMMILGQSPRKKLDWEQLIEIDQAQILVKKGHHGVDIKSRKIFVSVPYNYILSNVLDSLIGLIKAIKELHGRLLGGKEFTYFGPTCKNDPILIPLIYIKTHVFSIQLDDDPFESKLRNILRTGLIEQQKRLAYQDAFEEKIKELSTTNSSTNEDMNSTCTLSHLAGIEEAKKNLSIQFSQLWIKNINDQIQQEKKFYKNLSISENYRNSITSEVLDETLDELQYKEGNDFIIEINPRPLYPPLVNFSCQYTKIYFKPADFPLQETRQFIHTIGSGVPLDNNYSILIPFHLSIKAGQTWVKLRDYPLPLLYVPPLSVIENDDASNSTRRSRNQSRISWTLEGNYVLGDELGSSYGSRIIEIPIFPNYTLSAVRTTSPVKFYSVIDYHILTPSMSTICWSVSYSPVIQDIMRVFETVSADQQDPSSRLGFWDKVRFSIHTQTKLSFIGGGDLALVVKGTRDPYQLKGRGAGLTKIWSDQVVWLLGYKNIQHEFMQILSKQYAFGVPDLIRGGFVPNLPDSFERKNCIVQEPNRFLKIVLKLSDGIRMGIGLAFERLGCNLCSKCRKLHRLNRCRSQVFSPHYNVLFRSKKHVETFYEKGTYDAFHGFRSDFLHLSLSIIKLCQTPKSDPTSQNAMYISPCFIEHFSAWYALLGSPISIPIRQGTLFPHDGEKSKSFGDHLNTVKYKFIINPLAIGFFCTDEETYMNVKGGGSAGLKARVNEFSVDIHQRKELNATDETLKPTRSFHELEIEFHDIDLRVIKASQGSNEMEQEDGLDGFEWIDIMDYVILDSCIQHNNLPFKKINVHPFVFSPLFYFTRQNEEGNTERRDYLRETHDCIMGKGLDSHEFQKNLLERRANDLDRVIEDYDKQLDFILDAMQNMYPYEKEVADQHAVLVDKLNYLRRNRYMLHTYIAQLILETELNMNGRDSPHTTTSSIGRRDELSRWETFMGPFQDRFFIHNPQIIWNNSVRDAIYYWQEIKDYRSVQVYNLSSRCFKFLQDLVEKQQVWKPDVPVTNILNQQEELSENMTQKLIDKLLAERVYNYVAYNEKEENKSKQPQTNEFDDIHVFESKECVNDPDYQYKNIPDSYEMKSKYLIDMINPQVNFQSDKGLDHLILFTNERIHVKAFSIIDNSSSGAADKDVRLVKDRIIVALDNAQLLVAKRIEQFDLFSENNYGQCRNLHWAAWVHPEQLWYYKDVKYFDNFQRVASQLCGTIQLDRYNHLRIKINKYNTSRKSPFEDRTNTMQLHFPQFKLELNSKQGHILYYTLINLLLGNDGSPRKKERLSRFKDVMLAAERSDLAETVKQVGILQNQSRILLALHKKFMFAYSRLDSSGIREFNRNRKRMRQNLEKLYLVVEAIRCIQTFRRDIHLEETDHAKRFSFTSDEIVWEAIIDDTDQSSLCKWILVNTKFVFLDKQNGSSRSTIEVEKMQLLNTTDSPVFINVLDTYIEPGADTTHQKMLRGVLESLPPVGGIPVIQQLEINLIPLRLQISTAFGTAMKDYFFPRILAEDNIIVVDTDDSEEEYTDEEEEEDLVSLDVISRTSSRIDTLSLTNSVDKTFSSTLSKREGSFASFDLITKKVKETVRRKKNTKSDELTVMKNRSSTNRTFIYIRIPATKHCLSLRGPTQNTFYNLYNFPFTQPKLEYRNMTWSLAEMMEEIQKQFLRAALRHSPALLKNKLMSNNNKQATPSITAPSIRSTPSIKRETATTKRRPPVTNQSSFNTVEEDTDIKSLYSNPDEDLQRLIELQAVDKRISFNVDQELLDVYMKQYKQEEEEIDENVVKGRILFGESYNGVYSSSSLAEL